MKTKVLLSLTSLMAFPLCAADVADEVKAAAQKLADKPNYTWTAKLDSAQAQGGGQGGRGGGRFGGPPEGKTEKGGFTVLTYKMGETTTEAVLKGDKVAIKQDDEWKTAEELGEGGEGGANRGRFLALRAQQAKLPAAEAQELVKGVKSLKKEGDAYSGELSAEAIKQMFTFRGRPGGEGAPALDTSGLKGTAKFWVKDGVLAKYENHVEGKMTGRQDREIEVKRTTTVEIKDVGSTKVEVPAEAKKKFKI